MVEQGTGVGGPVEAGAADRKVAGGGEIRLVKPCAVQGLIELTIHPVGGASYASISKYAKQLLCGPTLVIDPSIGSSSSQPGYSWWASGAVRDFGVLATKRTGGRFERLQEIALCLRRDFPAAAVLVLEDVPSFRYGSNGQGSAEAQASLNMAIGAIMASATAKVQVGITPQTWRAYTDNFGYTKSDANDAVAIGWAVMCLANHSLRGKP